MVFVLPRQARVYERQFEGKYQILHFVLEISGYLATISSHLFLGTVMGALVSFFDSFYQM